VSAFREPVIGDEFDLETYGRPSAQRQARGADAPGRLQHHERSSARARRVNSHVPRPAGAAERDQRPRYDADGVRTVKISGQATPPRRRAAQRSLAVQVDRYDRRPDRAAQWALFMGVFMVVVAIVTGT
jgi:hypothetical protein